MFPGEAVLASANTGNYSRKRTYQDFDSDANKENEAPDAPMLGSPSLKMSHDKRVRRTEISAAASSGSHEAKSETVPVENSGNLPLEPIGWRITELEALLEAAKSREEKYRGVIQEKDKVIARRNEALKERGLTISRAEANSGNKERSLAQRRAEIASLRKTVSNLQSQLHATKAKNLKLDKQYHEIQTELDYHHNQRSGFPAASSLENQNIQLMHDIRHLDDELGRMEEQNQILTSENIQLRRDRYEAHKELHGLEQRSGILYSSYCWDTYRPSR